MSAIPKIIECACLANLQTSGPLYLGDATGKIFDASTGMLLAARLIITSGIGNSTSPHLKLHGPIPISELNLDQDYETYFLTSEMHQQPHPNASFSTGKGMVIICIIISTSQRRQFQDFEDQIEEIILSKLDKINFKETITGEIPPELTQFINNLMKEIYNEINELIELTKDYKGGSLFDITFIPSLPEPMAKLAKKLILHPKGILEEMIEDDKALNDLYLSRLVSKEIREGKTWIIPR